MLAGIKMRFEVDSCVLLSLSMGNGQSGLKALVSRVIKAYGLVFIG